MKKQWMRRLGAAVLAAALLAGCGGSFSGATNSYATSDAAPAAGQELYYEDAFDEEYNGVESGLEPDLNTSRKMIYSAYVRMETKTYDDTLAAIRDAINKAGAYVEYTDVSGSAADGDRWLNYTVRVPVQKYSSFLTALGEAGNVLNMNESAQDITSRYIDVEARLAALEQQRDRLNELAESAETTADLIEIETRLSDVQYEIENYTRQMRSMDDQITYSTVELVLREVTVLTPVTHTFADRLIDAFFSGWRGFGEFMQNLIIAIVYMMPVILLAAAILAIVLAATRKSRAQYKAVREAHKAARADQKAWTQANRQNTPAPPTYQQPGTTQNADPDDTPKPKY